VSDLKIMVGDGGVEGQTVATMSTSGGLYSMYFGTTKYAQGVITYIAQ
jgi:tartrate dehydratase beta subunit/fumarate hydratase class I family protein